MVREIKMLLGKQWKTSYNLPCHFLGILMLNHMCMCNVSPEEAVERVIGSSCPDSKGMRIGKCEIHNTELQQSNHQYQNSLNYPEGFPKIL